MQDWLHQCEVLHSDARGTLYAVELSEQKTRILVRYTSGREVWTNDAGLAHELLERPVKLPANDEEDTAEAECQLSLF